MDFRQNDSDSQLTPDDIQYYRRELSRVQVAALEKRLNGQPDRILEVGCKILEEQLNKLESAA